MLGGGADRLMPVVPLGIGAYKRTNLPEVVLRNLYLEEDKSGLSPDKTLRIQRPGLVLTASYAGVIRAAHYRAAKAQQVLVAGGALIVNGSSAGALAGAGLTPIVSTPFLTLMVADGGLYAWDTALSQIALPDDAPDGGAVQDVDQLNGYGLALLPNGRFYWLVPGDTTIDPLNYATAESLPDGGVAIRRLGDEFWIFGTEVVEVWQPTGDLDAPFAKASGRNLERGCLYRDAVRRFDNTLVWVGDDYQVYRAANVPEVISDAGISARVRAATAPCSAWTFGVGGHSFYVLTIPGEGTFAYDAATKAWSEFASPGVTGWAPQVGYQEAGAIVAGSGMDGSVYAVSDDAADDVGAPFERVVTATVPLLGKPPRNDSASLGIAASADCTVRMRWKDGQDDYPAQYEELDVRAPLDVAQLWRLGQPDQPYRTLEVSCVDPARITIAGLKVNEGWA